MNIESIATGYFRFGIAPFGIKRNTNGEVVEIIDLYHLVVENRNDRLKYYEKKAICQKYAASVHYRTVKKRRLPGGKLTKLKTRSKYV